MTADEETLIAAEDAFNRAMIGNDPEEIRRCISRHWVLVTPERGPVPGCTVLDAIAAGTLVHDSMSKQHIVVRVLGNTGFVSGRGRNTGWYRGERISADEWITDVYSRVEGCWLCELTHLTPAASNAKA